MNSRSAMSMARLQFSRPEEDNSDHHSMGFGVVASVLGGQMGFLLEKHYLQICKYCCEEDKRGKEVV